MDTAPRIDRMALRITNYFHNERITRTDTVRSSYPDLGRALHSWYASSKGFMIKFTTFAFLFLSVCSASGQSPTPLSLARTIPLPGITGKFDHFAIDESNNRLFSAATSSHAVLVIDLSNDKVIQTLTGFGKPHGLAWVASTKRLFAADGQKGELDVFEGTPLKQIRSIKLSEDADDMVYDPNTALLYVGHGGTDASNPSSVAVIDTHTLATLSEIPVAAHPEALEIDEGNDRIFVNISDAGTILVIDGKTHTVSKQWTLREKKGNTPLAFDAKDNLLLVGCRTPAELVVLNGKTGDQITELSSDQGADDLFYDEAHHRAYLITGSGAVNSYLVSVDGKLQALATTKTLAGAKTGLLVLSQNALFVGVPSTSSSSEIRVYAIGGR